MVEHTDSPPASPQGPGFILTHQQLELDLDFKTQSLNGKTVITINPINEALTSVHLSCRQCRLKVVTVNGRATQFSYQEPYSERFHIHVESGVHQHHQLRQKMAGQLKEPPEPELQIEIPKAAVRTVASKSPDPQKNSNAHGKSTRGKAVAEAEAGVDIERENEEISVLAAKPRAKSTDEQGFRFQPITIEIEYRIEFFRDGLHFVGWELDSERYPHLYTTNSPFPGTACCLFPCLDDLTSRCTWDISIKCPRTLIDALRLIHSVSETSTEIKAPVKPQATVNAAVNATVNAQTEKPNQHTSHALIEKATTGLNGKKSGRGIMFNVMKAMYPDFQPTVNEHNDVSTPAAPSISPPPPAPPPPPPPPPAPPTTKEAPTLEDTELDSFLLPDEDKAREMTIVCAGELIDENVDPVDRTKKVVSFACNSAVAARHIGFAIGPFEYIDLANIRDDDEDEMLGQSAVQLHGYCLPGRMDELRNTCFPTSKAVDHFTLTYGSYPFNSYAVCFVDEISSDITHAASLSICSERLLFPEDVMDPLEEVTQKLVHALAYQWSGVYIIPKEPSDTWITVGIAQFITDTFLKKLCGNNDYKFRQKKNSDRVCELDIGRPSLSTLGSLLSLDPSELDFMTLKSALVLFILDRRLTKASGSTGLTRIISRMFLHTKTGELANGWITNAQFHRQCEKLGHTKLDIFFRQWIHGAGCPRFMVTQRFNKKKLVVEMLIRQLQAEPSPPRNLDADDFERDVKEHLQQVKPATIQPVFTGPMTIRIHEADGTPYEHIVEIREASTKFEVPYNTKYKRLKRSKRQKEKAAAGAAVDVRADGEDEIVLYSLGDVLQSEEEIRTWRLLDWTKEDEDKMNQEAYEYIRMDADFEWICKMSLAMPGYMYLSQLQQDRDVVAQYESVQYIAAQAETALVSTILLRTLMDRRYFHGIRTTAAHALAKCGRAELEWIGLFHLQKAFQAFFCLDGSDTTPLNDFSDRAAYKIQCAIPQAVAKIRDQHGKSPIQAKKFLYELLRLNDNSKNKFPDWHYVCILMRALCDAFIPDTEGGSFYYDDDEEREDRKLLKNSIKEIDRYRLREEFESTWNSICAITALECKSRLAKAKLVSAEVTEFLQYTSPANDDLMRVGAFGDLISFASLRRDRIASYVLNIMSKDPSPYVRENLGRLFFKGLGTIAIGENTSENQVSDDGGLIIERESSTADRQAFLARKQTVTGALNALKEEIGANENFKRALWKAITSKDMSLMEMRDLLGLCHVLYEPKNSWIVKINYPRYYTCQNLGKGQLRFKQTDKFRTQRFKSSLLTTVARSIFRNARKAQAAEAVSDEESSDSDSPLINREENVRKSMPPPSLPKLKLNTKKRANPESAATSTAEPAPKKQKKSNATPTTIKPPTPTTTTSSGPKSKKRSNTETEAAAAPSTKKQKTVHAETAAPVAEPKPKKPSKSKASGTAQAETVPPAPVSRGKKRAKPEEEETTSSAPPPQPPKRQKTTKKKAAAAVESPEELAPAPPTRPKLLLKLKPPPGGFPDVGDDSVD